MHISHDIIKRITGSNYEKSLVYNKYAKLHGYNEKKTVDGYEVTAQVYDGKSLNVCKVNIENDDITFTCKCAFCKENIACAHIGAMLLRCNQNHRFNVVYNTFKQRQQEIYAEIKRREKLLIEQKEYDGKIEAMNHALTNIKNKKMNL